MNTVEVCTACGDIDEALDVNHTWELVADASELKAGDKIIIVANGYGYAMSTTQRDKNRQNAEKSAFVKKLALSDSNCQRDAKMYECEKAEIGFVTKKCIRIAVFWCIFVKNEGSL